MREWAFLHTELEWVYDHEVPEAFRSREVDKRNNGYWAWYVRKGKARVVTDSGLVFEAEPGYWLMVPTARMVQTFSEDAEILSVHFLFQWPAGKNALSHHGGLVIKGMDALGLERIGTKLERMVRRHLPDADRYYRRCFADYERFLSINSLFHQWLHLWYRIQLSHGGHAVGMSGMDNRLLPALRHLNFAPLNEGLPLEAILSDTGLGNAHLNRLFLAEQGVTLRKYWDQRRLKEARALLDTSLMPIKEVAYTLGFKADSHFMMWFKQHTGQRPREYRRAHCNITS